MSTSKTQNRCDVCVGYAHLLLKRCGKEASHTELAGFLQPICLDRSRRHASTAVEAATRRKERRITAAADAKEVDGPDERHNAVDEWGPVITHSFAEHPVELSLQVRRANRKA